MRARRGREMTRFTSHLGAIGAALILALVPANTTAQSEGAPAEQAQPLAETHWAGRLAWGNGDAPDTYDWTLYFRSDGVLVYGSGGATHEDGAWRQHNRLVTF